MTEVFVLQHVHVFEEGGEDVKMLGVYSSRALATMAMNRHRVLPGFADAPNLASPESDEGFHITPYTLNEDTGWDEGFITV